MQTIHTSVLRIVRMVNLRATFYTNAIGQVNRKDENKTSVNDIDCFMLSWVGLMAAAKWLHAGYRCN